MASSPASVAESANGGLEVNAQQKQACKDQEEQSILWAVFAGLVEFYTYGEFLCSYRANGKLKFAQREKLRALNGEVDLS